MEIYSSALLLALILTSVVTAYARRDFISGLFGRKSSAAAQTDAFFVKFQNTYLSVYLLAMFGDWLQGPYVYALYDSYGFSSDDIATLFVAGFGSSMVFGTFIGSLADKMGRKKFATLYCMLYILSCFTKHSPNYWVLMVGRILGGIATSLLFSVFDSWLVAEHNARGFDSDLLGDTFSKATFGNYLVAIVSGLIANYAAEAKPLTRVSDMIYTGGFCSPFDLAVLFLTLCGIMIATFWSENFGSAGTSVGLSSDALTKAFGVIKSDRKVLLIGLVSSLFEGSMYTFVFLWTPILSAVDSDHLPFGVIFAVFMVSCMGGSQAFGILVKNYSVSNIARVMLVFASLSIFIPVVSNETTHVLGAFMLFEVCVGIYWPCICTMKGIHVPEDSRTSIYNIFRVPLNAIVLFVLLSKITHINAFSCCVVMLALAAVCMHFLHLEISKAPVQSQKAVNDDEELELDEDLNTAV